MSVMLYCFRERELLLNINEMLAGFRMFPELHARRRPPRGSAARVSRRGALLPGSVPAKARRVRGSADQQRDLSQANPGRRRDLEGRCGGLQPGGPDRARRRRRLRRAQVFSLSRLRDATISWCRFKAAATSTARYLVRVAEMRESVKICRQALERISPTGPFAVDDPRITPPPKDRVYTEMEALIQHFLIYSQGFTVPAGEAYVPVEGPRGEQGFYRSSDGTNRPWRVKSRAPSLLACQALGTDDRRRPDRRRHRGHRIDRRRHGRRGPVSFHPADDVRRHVPQVGAAARRRRASRSPTPPENRARFDEIITRYPPDRRRSAVLPALYLVQHQQGYITANAMRYVAGLLGITPADVEDVVSFYTMFYTQAGRQVRPAGLPDAVVRAERSRAGDRGDLRRSSASGVGRDRCQRHVHPARGRVSRRLRSRAGGHGQRRVARVSEAGGRLAAARRSARARRSRAVRLPSRGREGTDDRWTLLTRYVREPNSFTLDFYLQHAGLRGTAEGARR